MTTTQICLRPTAPFRLDLTAWALRRRSRNAIDRWDGSEYSRSLYLNGTLVDLGVKQSGPPEDPKLVIRAIRHGRAVSASRIRAIVGRLLGLSVDMSDFYKLVAANARLKTLTDKFRGFHPPCFPTVFEAAVNAICCQQLSLEVGIELSNRLAAAACTDARNIEHAFPRPYEVVGLSEQKLHALGFSRQKIAALLGLARLLIEDKAYLEKLASLDDDSARARLLDIKGIGRWSADYILLRGMGRLNSFPGDDIAAQTGLRRWLGIKERGGRSLYDRIERALRRYNPFQGLIYFHLLLAGLDERGVLVPGQDSNHRGTGVSEGLLEAQVTKLNAEPAS